MINPISEMFFDSLYFIKYQSSVQIVSSLECAETPQNKSVNNYSIGFQVLSILPFWFASTTPLMHGWSRKRSKLLSLADPFFGLLASTASSLASASNLAAALSLAVASSLENYCSCFFASMYVLAASWGLSQTPLYHVFLAEYIYACQIPVKLIQKSPVVILSLEQYHCCRHHLCSCCHCCCYYFVSLHWLVI